MKVRRGEVWYANLDPTQGSEQSGRRPVLVLQNDAINRAISTVIAVPLTTNLRCAALPSCVLIAKGEGGLPGDSVGLCHQLRVLDEARLQEKIGKVSSATMTEIEGCVLFTLGFA